MGGEGWCYVWDVTWDTEDLGGGLEMTINICVNMTFMRTVVTKIKKGMPDNDACICIDTTRNHIVVVDWGKGLFVYDKDRGRW